MCNVMLNVMLNVQKNKAINFAGKLQSKLWFRPRTRPMRWGEKNLFEKEIPDSDNNPMNPEM